MEITKEGLRGIPEMIKDLEKNRKDIDKLFPMVRKVDKLNEKRDKKFKKLLNERDALLEELKPYC